MEERHDERRFPIAQEEREHHDSEQRAQEQRLQNRIDVERDVRALIAHDVERKALQGSLRAGQRSSPGTRSRCRSC